MAAQIRRYTLQEFEAFVALPEHADRVFEYVGGEIVEVPSNPYSSKIAMLIGAMLTMFVREHDLGHITGEAGGYVVSGDRYAPDVAFISYRRQPDLPEEGYCLNPPDLAVEVLSPSDTDQRLRIKIANYQAAGTVVWVVSPQVHTVEVYVSGQPVTILEPGDTLDGAPVLPGFTLPVQEIFSKR